VSTNIRAYGTALSSCPAPRSAFQ